ncbi:MAG: LPS export ABC transporter ATP-binding protein [Planctomycetota bacterium]|jgi:lipopolysaccharide export system ATP-binding protein|nr:LPS export ABC transporter ATP-binding protein [Planctomycetota bacterium]
MPLLEVRGLVKTYNNRRVVDGVDFHVSSGEIVGLLGPNGAGKTATFRIVMGLIRPEAGRVLLLDEDISRLSMYRRARHGMGYLSQEPSIFRNMTVEDNIMAILETQNLSRGQRRQRLDDLLSDMNLARLAKSVAHTLSGGERRRLEISRALVAGPCLLLLDEPFSGVDPRACEDIQKIIYSLQQRGISILITDHNVFETFTIVDRAYIIRDGRVLKHGTPQELVEDEEARRLYLGDKFTEYGDAFKNLRDEIRRKGRDEPIVKVGKVTRMVRLEEQDGIRRAQEGESGGLPVSRDEAKK